MATKSKQLLAIERVEKARHYLELALSTRALPYNITPCVISAEILLKVALEENKSAV